MPLISFPLVTVVNDLKAQELEPEHKDKPLKINGDTHQFAESLMKHVKDGVTVSTDQMFLLSKMKPNPWDAKKTKYSVGYSAANPHEIPISCCLTPKGAVIPEINKEQLLCLAGCILEKNPDAEIEVNVQLGSSMRYSLLFDT